VLAPGVRSPLLVPGDDRGELKALDRGDQGRMEDGAGQAVAEQSDA
jgi:hypothetical protein